MPIPLRPDPILLHAAVGRKGSQTAFLYALDLMDCLSLIVVNFFVPMS
jgi:hypothetical protein